MKSNYKIFSIRESVRRAKEILRADDVSYEELDNVPSRDKLTFTNGFYVYCSAIFIDIRGSSKLPQKYKNPTLAKIYRSYISELVAVMNDNKDCKEIEVQGDSVWGVFDTPYQTDIDEVFHTAYTANSVVGALNILYSKYSINPLTIGIGLSYGRALMIKAGYNGSGINEVVWMGDVVNEASKLCSLANKGYYGKTFMVSDIFYENLNKYNKSLLDKNYNHDCYDGEVVNSYIEDWLIRNNI